MAAWLLVCLYFQSLWLRLIFLGLLFQMMEKLLKKQERQTRQRLRRDWVAEDLHSLAGYVRAGLSLEKALEILVQGMKRRGGRDERYPLVWQRAVQRLEYQQPAEDVFAFLAEALDLAPLAGLHDALKLSRHAGASPVAVLEGVKRELEQAGSWEEEARRRMASRVLEGKAMLAAPSLLTWLLSSGVPAYMAPLYTGGGRLVLALVLGMQIWGAWVLSWLEDTVEERQALVELAAFMSQLALLLEGGLPLSQAWREQLRSAGFRQEKQGLGKTELVATLLQACQGYWLHHDLQHCASQLQAPHQAEALQRLGYLLEHHVRGGGPQLPRILRQEVGRLRQQALNEMERGTARREAGLLLPMTLLLACAMLLCAAPALLSLRG